MNNLQEINKFLADAFREKKEKQSMAEAMFGKNIVKVADIVKKPKLKAVKNEPKR